MTTSTELLDRAAGHLHAAAQRADELGHRHDSPSLLALAGQIRLNAAELSHSPEPAGQPFDCSIQEQLHAALDTLDEVSPLDGPPDLQIWACHVADLIHLAKTAPPR